MPRTIGQQSSRLRGRIRTELPDPRGRVVNHRADKDLSGIGRKNNGRKCRNRLSFHRPKAKERARSQFGKHLPYHLCLPPLLGKPRHHLRELRHNNFEIWLEPSRRTRTSYPRRLSRSCSRRRSRIQGTPHDSCMWRSPSLDKHAKAYRTWRKPSLLCTNLGPPSFRTLWTVGRPMQRISRPRTSSSTSRSKKRRKQSRGARRTSSIRRNRVELPMQTL